MFILSIIYNFGQLTRSAGLWAYLPVGLSLAQLSLKRNDLSTTYVLARLRLKYHAYTITNKTKSGIQII